MPPNTRQQVYITVEPIGQVRDWEETPEFTRALAQQQEDQRVEVAQDQMQGRPAGLSPPDLSEASLETLLVDIRPDRALPQTLGRHRTLGEILERQINRERDAQRQINDARENAPRPMLDPPRRSDSIQTDAEGNIGWRATATYHLRREIDVIADMIDRLERL
jgi:hypothetical protein